MFTSLPAQSQDGVKTSTLDELLDVVEGPDWRACIPTVNPIGHGWGQPLNNGKESPSSSSPSSSTLHLEKEGDHGISAVGSSADHTIVQSQSTDPTTVIVGENSGGEMAKESNVDSGLSGDGVKNVWVDENVNEIVKPPLNRVDSGKDVQELVTSKDGGEVGKKEEVVPMTERQDSGVGDEAVPDTLQQREATGDHLVALNNDGGVGGQGGVGEATLSSPNDNEIFRTTEKVIHSTTTTTTGQVTAAVDDDDSKIKATVSKSFTVHLVSLEQVHKVVTIDVCLASKNYFPTWRCILTGK